MSRTGVLRLTCPDHQAFERGVKVVGAIIAQDIVRVSHRDSVEDFVRQGKDVEALTLSRAVRLHLAAGVLVHRGRTVVFG